MSFLLLYRRNPDVFYSTVLYAYDGMGSLSKAQIEANIRDLNFIPVIATVMLWVCCMNHEEAYSQ